MPRVDLAPADDELLRGRCARLQLAHGLTIELGRKESHLIALRVCSDATERIAVHHLGQFVLRPHHDRDFQAEALRDLPLALASNGLWACLARKQDVAALEVRS